jgi:hypothetical protein
MSRGKSQTHQAHGHPSPSEASQRAPTLIQLREAQTIYRLFGDVKTRVDVPQSRPPARSPMPPVGRRYEFKK